MASVIWLGGQDSLDLGPTLDILKAMRELTVCAMLNGTEREWEYLASLPENLEQDAPREWFYELHKEAQRFLSLYREILSPQALDLLRRIISHGA